MNDMEFNQAMNELEKESHRLNEKRQRFHHEQEIAELKQKLYMSMTANTLILTGGALALILKAIL